MPDGISIMLNDYGFQSLSVSCPECGGRLYLKDSKFGKFYGCENWSKTKCGGSVGCHKGTDIPLGFPAAKEVREFRVAAHNEFDRLWKNGLMSRSQAYQWMREKMELPAEEAHIGMFDAEKCERLIKLVAVKFLKESS